MSDEPGSDRAEKQRTRREAPRSHFRSERRSARRAARRRKAMTRLWLVAGPVVVAALVVALLLTFLGGPDGELPTSGTTTTMLAAEPGVESVLLVIEHDGGVPAALLLHPQGEAGVVMAMTGLTLMRTAAGFKTLADLHASGEDGQLETALGDALGVRVKAVASVKWSALEKAIGEAGVSQTPAVEAAAGRGMGRLASAVLSLTRAAGPSGGATVWEHLGLTGDASEFQAGARSIVSSLSAAAWEAVALNGRLVRGAGFEYLEPDTERAKALLAGVGTALELTVEVQNGSGIVGVAEEVGEILEPLGYTLLPFRNADGFPDVERTSIAAAPDALADAEWVQVVLGTGAVAEDDALASGHMVIVLGSDYSPAGTTDTEPAG